MKARPGLAIAGLGLVLAAGAVALAAPEDGTDLKALLERFDRAYESLDAAAVAGLFAPDADVVFFHTDVSERWTGAAAIRSGLAADFKRVRSLRLDGQPPVVHARGALAWFERVMVMNIVVREGESSIFARATGVAEKRAGGWVLLQLHLSVGAPRDSAPHD